MRHQAVALTAYRDYLESINNEIERVLNLDGQIWQQDVLAVLLACKAKLISANEPRCCANCDFYSMEGFCSEFDEEVPQDFAMQCGVCDSWEQEIPF